MAATLLLVAEQLSPAPVGEDDALTKQLADGDPDALGALYARHGAICYRVALRITASTALAEEVVQEVFLALWRDGGFEERRGSLRAYLCALTHHKAVDAVRREEALARRQDRYGARERPVSEGRDEPEAAVLGELQDGDVRAALAELSPAQREVLMLAYFSGRTQREIAQITGVPLGTVKTRMFAGMRRLQAALREPDAGTGEDAR